MRIAGKQDWIARLSADVRRDVHARMKIRQYLPGEVITRSGEPATSIHQVQSGYVKILKDLPSGDQVLLALYIPGNVFSESAVIAGRVHHHTTIAATPVSLRVLAKDDFDELFHKHHEIPEQLCHKLAGSMSLVLKNRELSKLHTVRTRVALLFCNMADSCARPDGDHLTVDVPLTVSDIADFLGVTRQTVQKEVSGLKAAGFVQKTENRWQVYDVANLRDVARGTQSPG